jgi:propanol-preferring alcohol dehydrogenase
LTCRALESYPELMFAMVLHKPGDPLEALELPVPPPAGGEIRLKVHVCGLCRTDLHIIDGELGDPKLPLVMGHQIVGTVDQMGADVSRFRVGQRVGVPWLGRTCQTCSFCAGGQENLCDQARFTSMEGLPNTPWLTSSSSSPFPRIFRPSRRHLCSAPA